MENIYNIPGSEQDKMSNCIESREQDIEKKFITSTIELVIEALEIGRMDRRIVQSLLKKILSDKIDSRYKSEGLLQQYAAYVLETAGERIMKDLNIPEDIKINHNHAYHAKYADITSYLKAENKEKFLEKYRKEKKS